MSDPEYYSILNFLDKIGIKVVFRQLAEDTFLPGLKIHDGELIIDTEKLSYPGDILHEAGHIAVTNRENRPLLNEELIKNDPASGGNEMAAIAWSYAACRHLNIDAYYVFHENGYKGAGGNIAENFNERRYFGVPLLSYYGMTNSPSIAEQTDNEDTIYPNMINWLSQK